MAQSSHLKPPPHTHTHTPCTHAHTHTHTHPLSFSLTLFLSAGVAAGKGKPAGENCELQSHDDPANPRMCARRSREEKGDSAFPSPLTHTLTPLTSSPHAACVCCGGVFFLSFCVGVAVCSVLRCAAVLLAPARPQELHGRHHPWRRRHTQAGDQHRPQQEGLKQNNKVSLRFECKRFQAGQVARLC